MNLTSILQRQVENRALRVCSCRNQGIPIALGGRSHFESIDNGVNFIHDHYLLDSVHSDYSSVVARVQWSDNDKCWLLSVPKDSGTNASWLPYQPLAHSKDLTKIMNEIESDPNASFW